MRWSDTLIPTLREDPLEAEIASHKLMLRAGLIRRLSAGLYTFLPMGLRALRKVERIIRQEMDRAGAIEVLMPALQPRELWDRSHRYETMGDVMYRLRDRQERQLVLGPTHEEVITELAAHEIKSYRQLPKTFYQIQTKFRDEIRPRFGLMRAREFSMKDAYSFDLDWDAADASYKAMYTAYERIFARCGLRVKVVEADTGAMGGKWSHEFMVLAESGEDGIVECPSCSYAANMERGERSAPAPSPSTGPEALEEISTPGRRTIEEVSAFLKCPPSRLVKTLIYMLNDSPAAFLVPGDRDLNEKKVMRILEAQKLVPADAATIEKVTAAPVGFAGPVGLQIPIYADSSMKGATGMVAGANKVDTHVLNVDLARDARVTLYGDFCTVKTGDRCPRCPTGTLEEKRGIEVGHVFKLGTKYTEAFGATYLDESRQQKPMVMGCYGIGVTRTLQAVIEQNHDQNGIVWPVSVAPAHVSLLILNTKHAPSVEKAQQLSSDFESAGMEVVVDERDERPGVKLKDADLLGLPVRVIVSERSLGSASVEMRLRGEAQSNLVPLAEAVDRVRNALQTSKSEGG